MSQQGEGAEQGGSPPERLEAMGEYSCISNLLGSQPVPVTLGIAAFVDGAWQAFHGPDDGYATLIRGANGRPYIKPYDPAPQMYVRNEPEPIPDVPFQTEGTWVQYLARRVETWPDGTDARPGEGGWQQRPARRTGGWS